MVKLTVTSDLHGEEAKYLALVEHANQSDTNAVVVNGDFLDELDQERGFKYQESMSKIKFKYISDKERFDEAIKLAHIVQRIEANITQLGSKEKLAELVISNNKLDDKIKEELLLAVQNHESNKSRLEKLSKDIEEQEGDNLEKGEKESIKSFQEQTRKDIKSIDDILAGSQKPVYGVAGNHDPALVYEMKNVRFLERTKTVNIKGLRIAGNPSTYELPMGLPQELYSHLDRHGAMSDKDAEAVLLEKKIEELESYQRLKDEEIDVLCLHKGVGNKMTSEKSGYDPVAYRLVKEKRIPFILCGHFHSGLIARANDILGIRSGPDTVYEVDINPETKQVNYIDIYKFVRIGQEKKAA